jgi:hypothetical protein
MADVNVVGVEPRPHWRRWVQPVGICLTILLWGVTVGLFMAIGAAVVAAGAPLGVDLHQYQAHASRWLAGDGLFLREQLEGPYSVWELLPPLYPPTFLLLIVPFVWLPEPLWWAFPLGLMGYTIARHRPAWWGWAIIAVLAMYPRTQEIVWYGNPSMWVAAAVAAGTLWGWPAAFALLKPSLAPFALVGVRRRSWWLAVLVLTAISLPFGGLWLDYLTAVRNATDTGVLYSLRDVPALLVPLVAWASSRARRPAGLAGPLHQAVPAFREPVP